VITPKRFLGSSGPLSEGRTAFYRLRQVTATEEPASVVGTPAPTGSESVRVAEAQMRAERRLRGQRDTLRPLGLAVIVVVAVGTFNSNPRPAWHGSGLGVTLALAVFAISVVTAIRTSFIERGVELQAAVIVAIGAAGVALAACSRAARPGSRSVVRCGWRSPACPWRSRSRWPPLSRSRSMSRLRSQAAPPRRFSPRRCCAR
jgi:hypothetical protein